MDGAPVQHPPTLELEPSSAASCDMRTNPETAFGGGIAGPLTSFTTSSVNGSVGSMHRISNVCCVGAGYVGGPTCAVLAQKCPDIAVTVVDSNAARIAAWNSDSLPILEPGLSDVVRQARDGDSERPANLTFTTDVVSAIQAADLIFICVNTPTKTSGVDSGAAMDISAVEAVARTIARASTSPKIVVEKSTVPCHTADALRDILTTNSQPGLEHVVLSNPEFLAEGTAVRDLQEPDRVLVGCRPEDMSSADALADLYSAWIPRSRIITVNLWSSELAKVSANAFLAQRISSINSLSAICEATGADVDEIALTLGLDKRIGSGMLRPSVGFGGSCFKKDVLSLVYLAESLHLPEVAQYWRSVVAINEWQKNRFVSRILRGLNNTLTGKRIAVLGFAYKKNTGDTRESAAISVVNAMVAERANVVVYDPKVSRAQIFADLTAANPNVFDLQSCVQIVNDPHEACVDAHAVVILTECDEFRTAPSVATKGALVNGHAQDAVNGSHHGGLDWQRIASLMIKPSYVFDGRNVVSVPQLRELGFRVESIGKT